MKKLILCCDGTWNRADQEHDGAPCPTNVVKLAFRVAKRAASVPQIVYYDQGVGTGNALDRFSGGAFGGGLDDNIYDAYRFLIANYEHGDELFFFGFSRGAFTARSVAGMIRKCGIPRREYVARYRQAIDFYKSPLHPDHAEPAAFRKGYSVCGNDGIQIRFMGVWDTVGSLGIPMRGLRGLTRKKYQFHDTELSGSVERAYHALAIDEHRAPFEPTLWTYKPKPEQAVEQVWFCGSHTDVGGGYPESGLSDITLEWMIDKAREAGLAFDAAAMQAMPLHPDPLEKLHISKKGLYRLTPGIDRAIGGMAKDPEKPGDESWVEDPTQSVHASVRTRWEKDPAYRPAPLKAYLERS